MSESSDTWRAIDGFPNYEVSRDGRVRSVRRRGALMATSGRRYALVSLWRDGKGFKKLVHVLVLEAFSSARPEGAVCRHLDGDASNNDFDNLAWGTSSENNTDTVNHGRHHYAIRDACKHGREFTENNTRMDPRPNGRTCRRCLTCARLASRASKARRRQQAAA